MSQEPSSRIVNVDGRRRRPWALATQEKLLNAAVTEIAEKGFSHARLSDIAKRADMTAGSIYTWFENKEDLFQAALKHALIEQVRGNIENLANLEIKSSFVRQIVQIAPRNFEDDNTTETQKMLIECYYAAWRDPKARERLMESIDEHRQMYVDVLHGAQSEGLVVDDVDAESLATLLMAVHTGMATLGLAGVPRIPDEQWVIIINRWLDAFRR